MSIDDTLLLAYVDGELSTQERAQVEAAAAQSADVAARLAAIRASALPYKAAFDSQALPPVPPDLTKRVAELARVGASPQSPLRPVRSEWAWPRLAAAFFAGALLCAAVLKEWPPGASMMPATASISPWVQAVAEYQELYSRETVANVVEDRALTAKVVSDLHQRDGLSLSIPDLRNAGLTFKRIQRLDFHDQAVAQVVYLPERGDPIALCVTREPGPDEAPHVQQVGGMQTVTWRQARLSYVLLSRRGQIDLSTLGQCIASGNTEALYSRVGVPSSPRAS